MKKMMPAPKHNFIRSTFLCAIIACGMSSTVEAGTLGENTRRGGTRPNTIRDGKPLPVLRNHFIPSTLFS